jgi:adenylate kinase
MLLLGPTGSGKTPLGNLIQERGLWDQTWVHFDFGDQMRKIVSGDLPEVPLEGSEVELIGHLLRTGALLEPEQFWLAERILRSFLSRRVPDHNTCVVLNGLPRHVEQATQIKAIVDVLTVVSLRCTRETVLQRVRGNTGGDRGQRTDDDDELILAKLDSFNQRTMPLVDYYYTVDVPVRRIVVTMAMTPDEIWNILQRRGC